MPAGKVDRNVLASNYQDPGQDYLDTKTEGAFEVLAQQIDANAAIFEAGGSALIVSDPITGLAGVNVHAQMSDLKSQINQQTLGQIADGSIPEAKLAFRPATLDGTGVLTALQLPPLNYIPTSEKGQPNGAATLDATGNVPTSQLNNTVVKLAEVTLTALAANINIANIPAGYRELRLTFELQGDTNQSVRIQCNGIAGVYSYSGVNSFNGTVGSTNSFNQTGINLNNGVPAIANGEFSYGEVIFSNIVNDRKRFRYAVASKSANAGAPNDYCYFTGGGFIGVTDEINSILLSPVVATNLRIGSKVVLYGVK